MRESTPVMVAECDQESADPDKVSPPRFPNEEKPGLSARALRAGGETIVSVLMAKALANPELISLAAGFVDSAGLPVDATLSAVTNLLSESNRGRAALQYGTTAGLPALRQAILDRLLDADGRTPQQTSLSLDQVVITSGSNQLLHHLGEVLLNPGDIVLCAAPSYFVFLGILESLGARTVGVQADDEGIVPEALEATLRQLAKAGQADRVKAVYVTSYFDNPSGVSVADQRRPALVEVAKRHGVYLIEDIAYRELRYHGEDPPSLQSYDEEGDTVIQAGTFSKSFSPGIRVGWGILPPALVEPVLAQKGHFDFGSANFNQMLMAEVFAQEKFDAHVEQLQQCYREKMAAALKAADELLGPIEGVECIRPNGGLYVWVRLPDTIDAGVSGPLFDRAVEEGVLYVPGEVCYPREGVPAASNTLRLSFGVQSPDRIRTGVEALARAIRCVQDAC